MMRRYGRHLLAGAFAVLLLTAFAGLPRAAETAKKVRVQARQIVSQKQNGDIRLTTFSNAIIYQDDAQFNADTVIMRSEKNVHEFTCTGNPVFADPQTRITADKLIAFSTPRRAEFTGAVKMVSTPKNKAEAGKGEFRDKFSNEPTTVTADSMSYDYALKRSLARGNVVVTQKLRTVWANEAVYDKQAELIKLTGNVRMKNAGDEELKEMKDAETVTMSLENDWIEILAKKDGFVDMYFDVKDDDAKADAGKPGNGEKK